MKIEALIIMYEFQLKSLTETVHIIMKLVTFYFAIFAAIVGYVFSSSIDVVIKQDILVGVFIASILFVTVVLALSYGVIRGLADLKLGLRKIGKQEFNIVNMDIYFKRGRNVTLAVIACSLCIIFTLLAILIRIYIHSYA